MNMKRFFANDMRKALQLVKDELGAEAVILSNRRVAGGVEITAAVDFDQVKAATPAASPHTQAQTQVSVPAQAGSTVAGKSATAAPQPASTMIHHQDLSRASQEMGMGDIARADIVNEVGNEGSDAQSSAHAEHEYNKTEALLDEAALAMCMQTPGTEGAQHQPTDAICSSAAAMPRARNEEVNAMRSELSQLKDMLDQQFTQSAWGDFSYRRPLQARILRRLDGIGLSPKIAHRVVDKQRHFESLEEAWRETLMDLAEQIPVVNRDITQLSGVIALIGPTGVGKTTTIAKLATHAVLATGAENVALVTTDSFRMAAFEQLRALGNILGVPVRIADEEHPLDQVLASLSEKRLVLIDTAGFHHEDPAWHQQMALLSSASVAIKPLLVMPATHQRRVLEDMLHHYQPLKPVASVITKLDETASLGESLSVAIDHQLGILCTTNGQNIPDDIERATRQSLIRAAVSLVGEPTADDTLMAQQFAEGLKEERLSVGEASPEKTQDTPRVA